MVERWWRDIGKTVATLWRLCVRMVVIAWHFTTIQPPPFSDQGGLRMRIWAFDENRADFVEASPERMTADPAGCYIIQRGDDVFVREYGQERPMPERFTVAGVPFDREQFEDVHTLSLRAEMEQDGQWARAQLQARDRGEVSLPLELPIWVTKGLQDEPSTQKPTALAERLKRWIQQ